jgi:hypothetical protein
VLTARPGRCLAGRKARSRLTDGIDARNIHRERLALLGSPLVAANTQLVVQNRCMRNGAGRKSLLQRSHKGGFMDQVITNLRNLIDDIDDIQCTCGEKADFRTSAAAAHLEHALALLQGW